MVLTIFASTFIVLAPLLAIGAFKESGKYTVAIFILNAIFLFLLLFEINKHCG